MNYKYITATGTETVEISEEWADILCQFDREDHALEEKERYHRAFSMDDYEHEGSKLASHYSDPLEIIVSKYETTRFQNCFNTLSETQQRRLLMLSFGLSINEIAKIEQKDPKTIFESIQAARKKFKLFF